MTEPASQAISPTARAIADLADRSFHPVTLAFRDPALEAAYVLESNRRAVLPLRVVLCVLIAIIVLQGILEFVGVVVEDWAHYDVFIAGVWFRLGNIAIYLFALWVTTIPFAIRNGQVIVSLFIIALAIFGALNSDIHALWIERVATFVNFLITIQLVAIGLLVRVGVPIAIGCALAFTPVVVKWMEVPYAPLFVLYATVAMMSWVAYSIERAKREAWAGAQALEAERALTEALLLNVLPPSIAKRMRGGETLIADSHDQATVVFADIVNFTPLSASMSPEALVAILDEVFTGWDRIAEDLDLEKIKTIGDAYMMAAGLPSDRSADPAHALDAAIRMRDWLAHVARARQIDISMRAGVHIGPVVAGVIGQSKFVYDLWGDSVNVASRMESSAPVGQIQVSSAVQAAMADQFLFEDRGEIEVKGKGRMRVWLLIGRTPT